MLESVTVIEATRNPFLVTMGELFAVVPGAARVEERREQIGRSRKRGCVGGVANIVNCS